MNILLAFLCLSCLSQISSMKKSCTKDLVGRVAQFEYKYYPNYWIHGFTDFAGSWYDIRHSTTAELTKKENGFTWRIVKCGTFACIESLEPSKRGYYLGLWLAMFHVADFNVVLSGMDLHFEILCEDCETLSKCQLQSEGKERLYFKKNGEPRFSDDDDDSWYNFYIKASETKDGIHTVGETIDNCDNQIALSASIKYTSGIRKTEEKTHGQSTSISAELSGDIMEGLTASNKVEHRQEWTASKLKELSITKEVTVGGDAGFTIPKGHYATVSTQYAYYDDYFIQDNKFKLNICDCDKKNNLNKLC